MQKVVFVPEHDKNLSDNLPNLNIQIVLKQELGLSNIDKTSYYFGNFDDQQGGMIQQNSRNNIRNTLKTEVIRLNRS